jgi:hypothetical protein
MRARGRLEVCCDAIPVTGVKPDMSSSGNLMPQLFRVSSNALDADARMAGSAAKRCHRYRRHGKANSRGSLYAGQVERRKCRERDGPTTPYIGVEFFLPKLREEGPVLPGAAIRRWRLSLEERIKATGSVPLRVSNFGSTPARRHGTSASSYAADSPSVT